MVTAALENVAPPVPEIVAEVEQRLRDMYGDRLKAVYLYGSYARGDQRPGDSDIDLAVVLDRFDSHFEEIERTGDIRVDVSLRYGMIVSIQPLSEEALASEPSRLSRIIRREGVQLA